MRKIYHGDYKVSAADIAEKMGAGWNYGNTLEANFDGEPNETVWGNPKASQEMVNAVADAGFGTVRIPISYLNKIDDSNGFKIDTEWLERIVEVVDYCYNRGLFVIINIHGDGYHTINGSWLLCDGENQKFIKEKYRLRVQDKVNNAVDNLGVLSEVLSSIK